MARLNDLGQGKLEGPKLDPRIIIIRPGFNYRDTTTEVSRKHIDWLKGNIRAIGVQEPIRVEYIDGKVYLVNGECRLIACRELYKEGFKIPYKDGGYGPPLVPSITINGDEAEILAASMIANGSLPPSKLEFGAAADRLQKLGWAPDKIALYIPPHIGLKGSKALRYVTEAVELHQAPLEVKKAVKEGIDGVKISEPAALAVTRKNRIMAPEILKEAAKDAKAKGQTEVKRPKGEGKATQAKKAVQKTVDECLKLADALADVALDDNLPIDEVMRSARAYNKARGR